MSGASRSPISMLEGCVPLGGEREEKPECVSVCRDGVGAGAELAGETLNKEPLQGWGERGHGRLRVSRRAAASSISSGTAVRYQ